MATVKTYEELEVWQLARQLNIKLSGLFGKLQLKREFGLKAQIQDAAGSSMDNIAEGFERGGNKELIQFLAIAKGSVGEVSSQLYRISDFGFIENDEAINLQKDCLTLRTKLGSFIAYLQSTEIRGIKYKGR
jgi:four helix bundle protein